MPCSTNKLDHKVNNFIFTEVNAKKGEIFETTIAWYCDVDGPALLKLYWYTFATYKGILTNKPDIPTKKHFFTNAFEVSKNFDHSVQLLSNLRHI